MRINGAGVHVSGHTVYSNRPARSASLRSDPTRLRTHLQRIDEEVADLSKLMAQIRGRGRSASAPFAVGAELALGSGGHAVLESAAEVNTEATQLSSRSPQWAGPGGRTIGISGIYSGPDDDTLTFTVASANGRKIDVTDSTGALVDTINLNASGDAVSRATVDGLTIDFGAGSLTEGDSFTLGVKVSEDGAIDPGDAFDGVGDASARFEEGTAITDGSFQVNGTTVSVSASDSLNDVLARITAQVAGVTATYDPTTEKVQLRTDQAGADQTLEITGDTSGLIAALKLDGLGQATGTDGTDTPDTLLSELSRFSGVTAGTLTVNGTTIAIDPSTQTLNDVVQAINDIDGVTAELDSLDRVIIAGRIGEVLSLQDTSGFLDANRIVAGDRRGRENQRSISNFAAQRITAEVGQLREAIDALMDDGDLGADGARMRTELTGAISEAMEEAGLQRFAELTGLNDFADDDLVSRSRRVREVRSAYGDLRDVMLGQPHRNVGGLLDRLDDIVDDGVRQLSGFDALV